MIEFKIRAYGRMELAQLYSPELTGIAAYRKMNKWLAADMTYNSTIGTFYHFTIIRVACLKFDVFSSCFH